MLLQVSLDSSNAFITLISHHQTGYGRSITYILIWFDYNNPDCNAETRLRNEST